VFNNVSGFASTFAVTVTSDLILTILVVLFLALIGIVIWMAVRQQRLEEHYRALTAGVKAGNLESVLEDHVEQVRSALDKTAELDTLARQLERDGEGHMQQIGFLRFNPFRDAGGDQSFAVAVTDQEGNGVVISSLHSRDVTRVYGKPLAGWESPYPLTEEEQQAIKKARPQESGDRSQGSGTGD